LHVTVAQVATLPEELLLLVVEPPVPDELLLEVEPPVPEELALLLVSPPLPPAPPVDRSKLMSPRTLVQPVPAIARARPRRMTLFMVRSSPARPRSRERRAA
jgi:hypothetical protein